MSPRLLLLAAEWLSKSAEEYGNHGCNDYCLPADLSDDDIVALADLMNRDNWPNGIPNMADPRDIKTPETIRRHTADFVVIGALARGLEEMAKGER